MKCDCGEQMKESRGDVTMDEGGIKIALEDVRVFACPGCGNETHSIPKIEALFREVAHQLASKKTGLMPAEVRFLRKHLGLSGRDFARKMGVDHTTVSKWENGAQPMGGQSERALRIMVLADKPVEEYPLEEMATEDARPMRLRMKVGPKGWALSGQAA